ncbi:MAG: NFYB/HAP3 family transcription factor subunit [Candidatus Aenigmatarchaeota archaeon]|nr:NFYB/HAP3 family transcription factor subunit [Candidatus Aenigmarchaeota archaeon]
MPLPVAAIERVARKAGVERISADALVKLTEVVEDIGLEIALEAAVAARHAGRRTILAKDIKLVARKG